MDNGLIKFKFELVPVGFKFSVYAEDIDDAYSEAIMYLEEVPIEELSAEDRANSTDLLFLDDAND